MFEHLDLSCDCTGRFCRDCEQTKCHMAFHKDSRDNSGLRTICKECVRKYQKANIDRINETRRKTRREYADYYNAYNREYHRKNPESKKARNRKYRQENPEKIRVGWNSWRSRNAEEVNAYKREYDRKYRQEHPGASAANLQIVSLVSDKQGDHFQLKSGEHFALTMTLRVSVVGSVSQK